MSIQAVFFDIGGVVVHADLESYVSRAAKLFDSRPEDLRREVQARVPELETGKVDSDTFWKQVGESLWKQGKGHPCEPGASKGLWKAVMADSVRVDLNLLHLCWTLTRKKLKVGALSNTIVEHVEVLTGLGAYQPFKPVILSCNVGLRKPDKAIYKLAAKQAGVSPRGCLFIDDLEENLTGARNAGMQAVLFKDLNALVQELGRLKVI